MKYIYTSHALFRMKERVISKDLIEDAIVNPTKVMYDTNGRILVKKLYKVNRLLLIAVEPEGDLLRIITVIDTSKIKKYL